MLDAPAAPLFKKPLWSQPGTRKPLILRASSDNGRTLKGHAVVNPNPEIILLAFSADGRILASGKSNGTVELWSAATGTKLQTVATGRDERVETMAFSKDGRLLLLLFGDGKLMLWSVAAKKKLPADFGSREIDTVAIAPDGKTLALGTESGEILLWDLARRRVQRILQKEGYAIHKLAYSADGKRLASCERLGNCIVWDLEKKTSRPFGHLGGACQTLFFTSKDVLVAETRKGASQLFPDNRPIDDIPIFHWRLMALSPQGTIAALYLWPEYEQKAKNQVLLLGQVTTQRLFARLAIGDTEVKAVAFAPAGKTLAVGTAAGEIQLWAIPPDSSRELVVAFKDRGGLRPLSEPVRALALSPDGRTLAAAGCLWDLATGKEKHVLKQPAGTVLALAFSPDGTLLASGSTDHQVRLRDPVRGTERGTLSKQQGVIRCLTFTPDGKLLISGDSSGAVHVWDVATRKQRWRLTGHQGQVCAVLVGADGKTLLSVDTEGVVRFWDLASGKETRKLALGVSIDCCTLTPDRKSLVAATEEGVVSFWDLASGRKLALSAPVGAYPRSLAFAPGGRMLAAASIESGLTLWTVGKGAVVPCSVVMGSAASSVRCVVFAPDGRTLATGSGLGVVQVWQLLPLR